MSTWLERARASRDPVPNYPKSLKSPLEGNNGGFDHFGTAPLTPKSGPERNFGDFDQFGTGVVDRQAVEGRSPLALWEAFEERAAILEFDAGFPRHQAEDLAAREVGFADATQYRAELSATLPMIGGEYGTA